MFTDSSLYMYFALYWYSTDMNSSDSVTLVSFFFFFCPFRVSPSAYRSSQDGGQIRAVAAGLHHSHGNAGSSTH